MVTPSTSRLARMKWMATGLLAAAAVLYVTAIAFRATHPAWGYVAAFSEAAMVGAVADWFAVVALFRHPLGLPIPHTAIIPNNKDRIGENLASFMCSHFLGTPQVLSKLQALDLPMRLASWLSDPAHARQAATHALAAVQRGLGSLDAEAVRQFFRTLVIRRLEKLDTSRLAGELLQMLTAHGRHEQLLEDVARQAAAWLDNDLVKEKMSDVVAAEVKFLRFVGLDAVAGRYATGKMIAGVVKLLNEMADEPDHPMRGEVSAFMASFAERLKSDPALREKGEAIKLELLAHPHLAAYLQGLWSDMLQWTCDDLARPDSTLRERTVLALQQLGEQLARDATLQQWLQAQLLAAAPPLIERHREDIRRYIVERVHAWDATEMTSELEHHIGRDLQFIRINGTLVGGLVGLLIHTATQLSKGFSA